MHVKHLLQETFSIMSHLLGAHAKTPSVSNTDTAQFVHDHGFNHY